jgi:hypothetical protein
LALSLLPRALRHSAIRRLVSVDEELLGALVVKLAETDDEMDQAIELLYGVERSRGHRGHNPGRLTPHLAVPSTLVFVAKRGDQVVGATSLVGDSPLRLPVERTFAENLLPLRKAKRRMAEIGPMALAPRYRRTGLSVLLYKLLLLCARDRLGVEDVLIGVSSRGQDIYQACFLFEPLGEPRRTVARTSRTLVCMRLDLLLMQPSYFRAFGNLPRSVKNPYHFMFERVHPQLELPDLAGPDRQHALSKRLIEIARQDRAEFLKELTDTRIAYLEQVVPELRAER